MCIIIAAKRGVIPHEHLSQSLKNNPDGWGFSVSAGRAGLHVERGLDTKRFWKLWKSRPFGPVVFHARIKTHGLISLDNCHPFYVTNDLVVFHNGIIQGRKHKTWSDTRVFVHDVLQELPNDFLSNRGIRHLILQLIDWSRLVFATPQGIAWIANRGMGCKKRGVWYSNTGYLPVKPGTSVAPTTKNTTFDLLDQSDRRLPEYYRNLTNGVYKS